MGGCNLARVARVAACGVGLGLAAVAAAAALGGTVTPSETNWGGYVALAAQGQTFTSVTSTFTIPALDCSAPPAGTLLQIWTALDGAYPGAPTSIEQVGVMPVCGLGTQTNAALYQLQYLDKKGRWVVLGGDVMLNGTNDLPTGDSVTATVSHSATSVTLTLTDDTTGASGSVTKTCPRRACAFESAESMIEANGRIASFGTVSFSGSSATDSRGHTGGLVATAPWWNTQQQTLIGTDAAGNRFVPCAIPGPYAGGAFAVTSTGRCVTGTS